MLVCLAAFNLCAPVASKATPFEIEDDLGTKLRSEKVPERVVSLLPSLTETICALGHCNRLVGVDRYSNWPQQVTKLPQVGGGIDPNIEAIVALRPDVVVMASSSRGRDRLAALGVRVLALEPKTHTDVQRVIGKLGTLMQEQDAQRLWRTIDAGVSAAAQALPAAVRKQRVYIEVNRAPYAAGPGSFVGETLARLGAQNIIDTKLGPFPKINPELVVRANPDVIMVGDTESVSLAQRPGWGSIAAIRSQSVCYFPREQSEVLVRPGPRMAEGARIMADCLLKTLAKKP
ncbi:helical backbone metal receptor [Variovorax sp. PCZ-1]|uniref:ABC transporter substrate-binding protein n=1 Tax=Variovorax sp. PCZ-1 TaxID=2835533 RepID=UPI0020BF10BD|nr:helical backbone metal receptor [Variovorax sp. PCZ-1]